MRVKSWINISRFVLCFIISVVFMLNITHWLDFPILKRLDNIAYDFRLSKTMPNTSDPRIVILDIDEKSLDREGRWPWPRNKLSDLVDILFEHYHIKLLAFDVTFPEKDTSSGLPLFEQLAAGALKSDPHYLATLDKLRPQLEYDKLFMQSLKQRNIVLGYFTSSAKTAVNGNTELPKSIGLTKHYDFTNMLIHADSYGANLAMFQQSVNKGGFFNNPLVDSDGSYRRLPLLVVYNDQLYEALSLAIFRQVLEEDSIKFNAEYDYDSSDFARLSSIEVGSYKIPVNEKSSILVPYRGMQGSFNYISVSDVLAFEAGIDQLNNKIVILGSSAIGVLDLRSTPVQNVYPGVEIHANIVSGMLDRRVKYRPSHIIAIEFILLFCLAIVGVIFFPKLSAGRLSILFIVLLSVIITINFYLWVYHHIDSLLATPVIFIFILFILQITFGFLLETYHKKHLAILFGQYIPPELVDRMAMSDKDFSLSAEDRELTVLFSDVRGFTSISENLNAHELSDLMNKILSPITKLIFDNKGTIDKYMGDAIMAFWGAPIESQTHASDALRTALAITPAMHRLEQEFAEKGWPEVKLGIGLNTGIMSVGNMGSEYRIAYTVLGDAVNLGSRLEGLTKQYGVNVIVSEFTKNSATEYSYKELDKVRVKGKLEPIKIF